MQKAWKAFINARVQTKIFFIFTILIGLLTLILCFYPYFWIEWHRSEDLPRQIMGEEGK